MTTIAYRANVMACDSCWSYDDGVDSLQSKIKRLPSGALLGSAGDNDSRELERLLANVKTAAQMPTKSTLLAMRVCYLGILVLPKGKIFKIGATHISEANWDKELDEDIGVWEISGDFTAVGTGSRWAMGAMAAGRGAIDAVKIGCRFDLNSRAPVYSHHLVVPKKTTRKK